MVRMPKQDDNGFCEKGVGSVQARAKTESEGIVAFLSSFYQGQMDPLPSGLNCADDVFCLRSRCGFAASLFDVAGSGIAFSLQYYPWPSDCLCFVRFLVIEKDCERLAKRPW